MDDDARGGPEDRRRHRRYEVLAQVRTRYSRDDYVLELTNISRSGAFVQLGTLDSPSWLARGRTLDLSIIVPLDLDSVEVQGKIVRIVRSGHRVGFAVEFVALSADGKRGIERLIELGRPQPPPLPKQVEPPPLPMPNRRRHVRYELLAAVHTHKAADDYVLELTNISSSGALMHLGTLERPPWVRIDESVELSIVDPATLEPVHVNATIVRVEQRGRRWGFAVQFLPLAEQARAGVERLLAAGRPQPPPLPKQPPPLPK